MGASADSSSGQGLATPVPGAADPAVASLLHEFADVFLDPVFPPADRVTHDIVLVDEAA